MATEGRGSQHFLKRGEANYHFEKEDQKEEKLLISALFGPQTHHSNTLHLHLLFMVVLIMAVVVIIMVVMIMIVVIYIQDKVNTADSASKSMVRLVRAEKLVLSGLVFARKIARMILIQNI